MADPAAASDTGYWQIAANAIGAVIAGALYYFGRMKGKYEGGKEEEEVNEDFIVGAASIVDTRPVRKELAVLAAPIKEALERVAVAIERQAKATETIAQEMAERSEADRERERLVEARKQGRAEALEEIRRHGGKDYRQRSFDLD